MVTMLIFYELPSVQVHLIYYNIDQFVDINNQITAFYELPIPSGDKTGSSIHRYTIIFSFYFRVCVD